MFFQIPNWLNLQYIVVNCSMIKKIWYISICIYFIIQQTDGFYVTE